MLCYAIIPPNTALGGGWITDPDEQAAVLDVLRRVDREDSWPTLDTEKTLRSQWQSFD